MKAAALLAEASQKTVRGSLRIDRTSHDLVSIPEHFSKQEPTGSTSSLQTKDPVDGGDLDVALRHQQVIKSILSLSVPILRSTLTVVITTSIVLRILIVLLEASNDTTALHLF